MAKEKTVRVNFRIPEGLYRELRVRAAESHLESIKKGTPKVNMTEFVIEALQASLKRA